MNTPLNKALKNLKLEIQINGFNLITGLYTDQMEILRFDFNGSSSEFRRTPQGFLRVNARLTMTGIFNYDSSREYRSEEEVFRTDSLESIKGAPVTELPLEKRTRSLGS